MSHTEAVITFLEFIQNEMEGFEDEGRLSPKSEYMEAVNKFSNVVKTDTNFEDYVEHIFKAKSGNDIEDVYENLDEMAEILEEMIDD